MGLVEGLGKRGKKVTAAIRQPSGGPTMNIKDPLPVAVWLNASH
jgi:formyltetrahydrofolate synthetase